MFIIIFLSYWLLCLHHRLFPPKKLLHVMWFTFMVIVRSLCMHMQGMSLLTKREKRRMWDCVCDGVCVCRIKTQKYNVFYNNEGVETKLIKKCHRYVPLIHISNLVIFHHDNLIFFWYHRLNNLYFVTSSTRIIS